MERSSKRSGRIGVAFTPGRSMAAARASAVRSTIRAHNARVQRAASLSRGGRLRRRNSVTAGFLGIETKFYDTGLAATAIPAPTDSTGGELDPSSTSMISTPAQGDTEQNRDGKKIVIKNVQFKGQVYKNAQANQSSADNATFAYVAIVLDTQSNAAQMNSEDCFKNTNATVDGAPFCMRNLLFSSRFRVLKDWRVCIKPPTLSWDGTNMEQGGDSAEIDWFYQFPDGGLPVNFNSGTTASIANVIDNSLHVIAFADVASSVVLAYNARIRFQG